MIKKREKISLDNSHLYILDSIPNPVVEVNENFIITLANKEAKKRWPSIVAGKIFLFEDVLPAEKKAADNILKKTFRLKKSLSAEVKSKKGEIFDIKTKYLRPGDSARVVIYFTDISAQKKVEESLKESELKYSELFYYFDIPITYISLEGTILLINNSGAKNLGGKPGDFIGKSIYNILPDIAEITRERVQQVEKSGKGYNFEDLIEITSGKKWFRSSFRPIRNSKGEIFSIQIDSQDVSEEKRALEALHKSEEKYRTIFESSPEAIVLLDSKGNLLDVNNRLFDWLGYKPEEVIGKNLIELPYLPNESMNKAKEKFFQRMKGREVTPYELDFITRDGEKKIGRINATIIRNEGGKTFQNLIIISNITEHKRAEEERLESLNRNKAFFQAIPDLIFIITRNGTLIEFKADRYESLAIPPDEIIGKNIKDAGFSEEYLKLIFHYIEKAMETGVIQTFEYKLKTPKGLGDYECRMVALNETELLVIVRDITQRKQDEEALKNSFDRLKRNLDSTILAISKMVEINDPYTSGHQLQVAKLARLIAKKMGLSEEMIEGIYMAGVVHDIGKIAIPNSILSKPGELTELEFNIIKTHPQVSCDILKTIEFPWPITDIVIQHHERLDGSGYPYNLHKEDIRMEARILAVADVVESISNHRPYRPVKGINKAIDEIFNNKGVLYDKNVVKVCVDIIKKKEFSFNE